MSSIIVLRQRSSVHLMCDAAVYDYPAGILRAVDLRKCYGMPALSAAVSCTGPAPLGAFFGDQIPRRIQSFDELIARGNEILPELFEQYAEIERDGDACSTLYLAGWHESAQRPAAYSIELWTESSSRIATVLDNSANAASTERYKLEETILAGTPMPGLDLVAVAGLVIPDDENEMSPDIDLLHLMEVQRHEATEGRYWVGGHAFLTSIDRRGITQRIIHRWEEDEVGKVITPLPVDWKAWRATREATAPVPFVSRLKRQMQDRWEKKKLRNSRAAPSA